jgi:hypothetical protein
MYRTALLGQKWQTLPQNHAQREPDNLLIKQGHQSGAQSREGSRKAHSVGR